MEPAGVTAHPDHMAVSAATQAAFGAYLAAPREREPRFYYWGVPKSSLDRFRELGRESGFELPGEDDPFGPRGTADDEFTCWVDTSPVAEAMWRSLREHRTQDDDYRKLLASRDSRQEVFAQTCYIRIHPASRPGEPPETSLVEAFGNG
jgi:LmbE family N-acetylglucosaminyl deacetylase